LDPQKYSLGMGFCSTKIRSSLVIVLLLGTRSYTMCIVTPQQVTQAMKHTASGKAGFLLDWHALGFESNSSGSVWFASKTSMTTPHPAGLLQPLPIPTKIWSEITLDFIEGLPPSQNHSVILVVVDRLSKYSHFISLSHPYTAAKVAQLFISNILQATWPTYLHHLRQGCGIYQCLLEGIFRLQGTTLKFSTSYHPQTDGQTKRVNQMLGDLSPVLCARSRPRQWTSWLPWAEFWYNTMWHASIQMTPFEAVYGVPPPRLLPMSLALPRWMLWMKLSAAVSRFWCFFSITCNMPNKE
jgi:hypothetical protein